MNLWGEELDRKSVWNFWISKVWIVLREWIRVLRLQFLWIDFDFRIQPEWDPWIDWRKIRAFLGFDLTCFPTSSMRHSFTWFYWSCRDQRDGSSTLPIFHFQEDCWFCHCRENWPYLRESQRFVRSMHHYRFRWDKWGVWFAVGIEIECRDWGKRRVYFFQSLSFF